MRLFSPARRLLLTADVALRLGPLPVTRLLLHRLGLRQARRRLLDDLPAPPLRGSQPRGLVPAPRPTLAGPVLPGHRPAPPPLGLTAAHQAAVLMEAAGIPDRLDWHGPFDPAVPALGLALFAAGDIRPVWETNRLAALPLLAQAHRLHPQGGHGARAAALLADWTARNPAFHGPAWACGQEAALRVLHLMLALALLDGDRPVSQAGRALLALHARRIAATPHYAAAQDNNHPVSEAAGLFACGLGLQDAAMAARGARRLARSVARLVAPDGSFAQVSPAYHRLMLDVLALAEWLRRRHAAPPFAPVLAQRAAAATAWLQRLTDPATGALPRIGHVDDSALADLSRCGPPDARGSLARAGRLFGVAGESPLGGSPLGGSPHQGHADPGRLSLDSLSLDRADPARPEPARPEPARPEPGCLWLGLPAGPPAGAAPSAAWHSATMLGWSGGGARLFLRAGRLRFRPGHADLLHADLWDGAVNLLRDGGSGAYNPPADRHWWLPALQGTQGHNTIAFDGQDQMPRLSRFLFARWPAGGALLRDGVPVGGWLRDARGNRQERRIARSGRVWRVEDQVAGGFNHLVLRWRLCPGRWHALPQGVEGPAGRVTVEADGPLQARLTQGWESPSYGVVGPAPLLEVTVRAPISRITTIVTLP